MKMIYKLSSEEVVDAVVLWLNQVHGVRVNPADVTVDEDGTAEAETEDEKSGKDGTESPTSSSEYHGPTYRG